MTYGPMDAIDLQVTKGNIFDRKKTQDQRDNNTSD